MTYNDGRVCEGNSWNGKIGCEGENARLREDVKKRDRTISQLNCENKRLKGIVESVRNTVNH